MRPLDVQQIGDELAVRWDDGTESYIPLEKLRQHCPCAACKGEADILGNVYKNPTRPLTPEAYKLKRVEPIGGYAIQPIWADGHASGIYSYEYLKAIGA